MTEPAVRVARRWIQQDRQKFIDSAGSPQGDAFEPDVGAFEDVPEVNGMGNELQRVVVNLLVNARQATPEGGVVRITLKHCSDTNEVLLSIRDTGTGIAPDVLPKIFDPFFSTKSGPDASGKGGTGVGLASCKEIIDAHSGRIRVDSTVGKGTAFSIRLPAVVTETDNG